MAPIDENSRYRSKAQSEMRTDKSKANFNNVNINHPNEMQAFMMMSEDCSDDVQ